jgi:tRNA nucleotidyltransferase (CCA-adding enzyme)
MLWQLSREALEIINMLEAAGYEANAVGGCVRDLLRGVPPSDWDINTSASPEEMQTVFAGMRTLTNGLKHGTLMVFVRGKMLEVTSYRGGAAEFSAARTLAGDLGARDFTVNAMAYHPTRGLVDPYGGREDLAAGVLRAVGRPADRYLEDGLRVLRALRFASVLALKIEAQTARKTRQYAGLLQDVAVERIYKELSQLLIGKNVREVLLGYSEVIGVIIPEILPMVGFDQRNPHHIYDVYEHSVRALEFAPPTAALRLTMLLHDIGKPGCFSLDGKGVGHFYRHEEAGAVIAERILTRLHASKSDRRLVGTLIRYHDMPVAANRQNLKKWLRKCPPHVFRQLLQVKIADCQAHSPVYNERLQIAIATLALLEEVLARKEFVTLAELALKGGDLIALGIPPGRDVGELLKYCLQAVNDGVCPNEKSALLELCTSTL